MSFTLIRLFEDTCVLKYRGNLHDFLDAKRATAQAMITLF